MHGSKFYYYNAVGMLDFLLDTGQPQYFVGAIKSDCVIGDCVTAVLNLQKKNVKVKYSGCHRGAW